MSNEEHEDQPKPQETEKTQTDELKNILHEMDHEGIPQLKVGQSISGTVKTPTFIKKDDIPTQDGSLQAPPQSTPSPPDYKTQESSRTLKEEKPTGNFFTDTEIFFNQLGRAYKSRYELWEATSVAIMKVLKKMRTYNEIQSGLVINTIEEIEVKLMKGLKTFEMKRSEVERYAGIEFNLVIKGFKKTLDLLQFQIKQLKLQNEINELYQIFAR